MTDHSVPDADELLAQAQDAMEQRADDAELRQAYDQLIADRTNGESLRPACDRLRAALGEHD